MGECVNHAFTRLYLLASGNLRRFDEEIAPAGLLEDREESGVEEPELKQHEERQRAVDVVLERVEDREREVEAERHLHKRLDRHRLMIFLVLPAIFAVLDAILRRAGELAGLVQERFDHRA